MRQDSIKVSELQNVQVQQLDGYHTHSDEQHDRRVVCVFQRLKKLVCSVIHV